jgi:hypothetical protein
MIQLLMVTPAYSWSLGNLFKNDKYAENGFEYAYPESSGVSIVFGNAKNGRAFVRIVLDPDDYSGGSICRGEVYRDVRPFLKTAALRFWIRGASGGEKAWIALVDEEKSDGHKTVVRLPVDWFGGIKNDWTLISIPLESFGEQGVYWDAKELREVDNPFDWNHVAEFRIESKKGENPSFDVQVDDIVIVKLAR